MMRKTRFNHHATKGTKVEVQFTQALGPYLTGGGWQVVAPVTPPQHPKKNRTLKPTS